MIQKDRKYTKLYHAALELFATYGYKKTTVEDVADKLGMTKGNLYFYVSSKKDLYEKTVRFSLIQWKNSVSEAVSNETDIVSKFRTMAIKSFEYIEQNRNVQSLLMKDPSIFTLSKDEDRFLDITIDAMTIIRDVLNQGISENIFYPVDVDHITEYLFSIYVMFLIKNYVISDSSSSETLFLEALELNLRGLLIK